MRGVTSGLGATVGIVLLCVGTAVTYGVLQDQVTARVSLDYFTVGHRDVGLRDPMLIALYWGFTGTWWVGLAFGIVSAFLARFGPPPRLGPNDVVKAATVIVPVVFGVGMIVLVASHSVIQDAPNGRLQAWVNSLDPFHAAPAALQGHQRVAFVAVLSEQLAAYATAAVSALTAWVWIVVRRVMNARSGGTRAMTAWRTPAAVALMAVGGLALTIAVLLVIFPV